METTVKNIGVKLDQKHLDMLNDLVKVLDSPVASVTTSGVVKYAIAELHKREVKNE